MRGRSKQKHHVSRERRGVLLLLYRNNGAELERASEVWETLLHEGDCAFCNCIERVVLADANAGACMNFCATLADDDVAGANLCPVRALDAKALCLGVAAVSCRTLG